LSTFPNSVRRPAGKAPRIVAPIAAQKPKRVRPAATIAQRLEKLDCSLAEAPGWLLLSRADVALILGRPLRTIEDWARRNVGPRCRVVGGRVTYKLSDVQRWVARAV
jgi:hypothetical protein